MIDNVLVKYLLCALCLAGSPAARAQERTRITFGIVLDGPSNYINQQILDTMKNEVSVLLEREYEVSFPAEKQLLSEFRLERIKAHLDALLADDEVDMVLCFGVLSSMEAAVRGSAFPKPVFAPFAIGSSLPIYPSKDGGSGVPNFNYLTTPNNLPDDLAYIKRIVPGAKVHVIVLDLFVELIPGLRDFIEQAFHQAGAESELVLCSTSADEVLSRLPATTRMVYVTPLLRFDRDEKIALFEGLAARHIPSFSLLGREDVTLGALAGLMPESDYVRWFRRLALNIQRVLLGEPAEKLPVIYKGTGKLVLNMKTGRDIGWYPSWALQVEAELLNEEPENIQRRYNLQDTVRRALAENLDVQAGARNLDLGHLAIDRARAARKPSLYSNLTYLQVDEDSAAASFGSQPEHETTATLTAEQLLFGDEANAQVTIQQQLQSLRLASQRILELDTALEAANRFLNYLKARTLYRVQKDNLELTNSNLETAKIRKNIGIASPAEVYRWEARKATDRLNALTAKNQAHVALNALNQILNESQEVLLDGIRPDRGDSGFPTGGGQLDKYVGNAADFEIFRQFMVEEGLRDAPELAQIDALARAKEREVLTGERAYFLPTISLRAALEHELDRSGGSAGLSIPGLPDLDFPQQDETRWNVALNFSLPLFRGGVRKAALAISRVSLAQLAQQRESLAQRLELRIRSSLQRVATTNVGIQLQADAAEAARKNLELVEDAYAKGVAASIDLLDAQNAALVAREAAANAEFDFFLALMESQRAVASFSFLESPEQRQDFFRRLDDFFQKYR